MHKAPENQAVEACEDALAEPRSCTLPYQKPQEIGGPAGLEPTRFGDWERKGRCIDF